MTATVSSREIFALLSQREQFRNVSWPVRLAMRKYIFSLYGVDQQGTVVTAEDEDLVARHPDYRDYCLAVLQDLERKLGRGPWTVQMYLLFIWSSEEGSGQRSSFAQPDLWFMQLPDHILRERKSDVDGQVSNSLGHGTSIEFSAHWD